MKTVTIKRTIDNEYIVPAPDGREMGNYYTDDKEDASGTAHAMYKGQDIKIRFKSS